MNKLNEYKKLVDEAWEKLSPEGKAAGLDHGVRLRKAAIEDLTQQVYSCRFANMQVTREGTKVKIEWKIRASGKDPNRFHVTGTISDIQLILRPETYTLSQFYAGDGSDCVDFDLEQGRAYYFSFQFLDVDDCKKPEKEQADGGRQWLDMITFQLAIPLSEERKELLKKAVLIVSSPAEKVRHELRQLDEVEDAIEDEVRKVVEKIKGKKLPQEQENEKIERYLEKIARLKDELDM